MKLRAKRLLALAMAGVMALSMAGCGGSGDSGKETTGQTGESKAPAGEGAGTQAEIPVSAAEVTVPAGESVSQETDVVGAILVDFTTMDPMDTSDTLSGGIQRMMMDGLFGFDDNMKIIPMLATDYEANEDATEYVIHLRQAYPSQTVRRLTQRQPRPTWTAGADKELGLKRTTLLCNVIGSTEIVDDYTVKVKLSQSFGAFISTLAHPACVLMSPKVIAEGNDACAERPVGTGQYIFKEWIAGDHATVTLNKDWWGYDAEICGGTAFAEPDAGL